MVLTLGIALLTSFIATLVATPITRLIAKRWGLVDDPARRRHPAAIHHKPVARAGGLAIFIGIVIGTVAFLPLNSIFLTILLAGFLVVIVGLLDDKYDLSPYIRFFMNIFCAGTVVFSGLSLPYITNPLGGILHLNSFAVLGISFSSILAVLWIVWVMNMLNWSKGVDGQMPGIAAISAGVIGIASLRFTHLDSLNITTSIMSFIVAGASLGFLIYNFYPAKIFPGYSATILGFIIGILSLLSSVKLATALLVMGVPTADALFTISRRILSKKSPFWHDKGHLHHLLLDLGFSQRAIALFYWFMSFLLGVISLHLSSRGKLFAIIVVIVFVAGGILALRYLLKRNEEVDE